MKRPFMGIGIALAAGVAAGWFGILWWLICLAALISTGISIIGYLKKYWTDRTCKYLIGLSVFFVVGFCRGNMCLMNRAVVFNEMNLHIQYENQVTSNPIKESQTSEVLGTVKRIQKKKKVDYLFVEDATGKQILIVVKKELMQSIDCYKGQVYWIEGEAELFESATNPGQFDEADYYSSFGVTYRIWADDIRLMSEGDLLHQKIRWLEDLKTSMIAFYEVHMGATGNGILQAAVLGERSALDADMKRYYQENGWMHLITTSGLHLSFIAMSSYRRMRKMTVPMVMSTLLAWVLMLGYGYMTDYGDSMLRAMGMMILALTAKLVGRRTDGWTSLAVLAASMLFLRPARLLSAGFLLTYTAVGGMEFGKWLDKSHKNGQRAEKFRENFFVQAGIFICTLPILLCSMYEIPVFGFFYNFFMIPLISLIVPLAFAAGVVGALRLPFFEWGAAAMLKCLDWILELVHKLPSKVWVLGCPKIWQIFVFGIGFLCAVLLMNRKKLRIAWMIIVMSCMFLMFLRVRSDEVIFMDVGQGDGVCILTKEGQAFLVDGGSSDVSNIYTYRIEPLLKYYGIDRIDGWFLSHSDRDHISGIQEALEEGAPINYIYLPDCKEDEKILEIRSKAGIHKIDVRTFRVGNCVRVVRTNASDMKSEIAIECLYPLYEECRGDKNNDSMVLGVRMNRGENGCHILLTGDLEMKGEQILMARCTAAKMSEKHTESNFLNNIDILKVAHHGSSGGTSEAFLMCIEPEWGIISCGKENPYGHPHAETLERLSNAGCRWVSTASRGAVFVRVTRKGYAIYTYENQD